MKEYIQKARTIVEALPYIQKFYGKTIVVKYGGNAMINESLKENVMMDFVLLRLVGINLVVVHGGGPQVSDLMNRLGKESVFLHGHRVTDHETMGITEMVLSGLVNKEIVAKIHFHGGKAVGISGKDAGVITAEKKLHQDDSQIDFGQVGVVKSVNPELIVSLTKDGYIPVISPVGMGEDGQTYNLNADVAAGEIAASLKAFRLIYMTDIKGIYRDIQDEDSFLSSVDEKEIRSLKQSGIINGGMVPKIDSAVHALREGVRKVQIVDGRVEHSVILELMTDAGIGTQIMLSE